MLEVTHGHTKNPLAANQLRNMLLSSGISGSLYIGYPVLATADESITVDALLVTLEHGLVAFSFSELRHLADTDISSWKLLQDRQDKLFVALENTLRRHDTLREGRRLGIEVRTIMLIPNAAEVPKGLDGDYADFDNIVADLRKFPPMTERYLKPLQAALQRVSTIKPPKRRASVSSSQSKGAILRKIEAKMANLDRWQRRAAIESPDGPQRIRGLAGSGKTIVLALKAAYLHAQNPDWTIAVTFWSRALYQQFEDLVRRFSFEHLNDEPNWQNLRILHAWGASDREGLYQQIAVHCGLTPLNYLYGKSRYGMDGAFEGVCAELLSATRTLSPDPIYDAVLIDEAQDLPVSFFKMVRKMTRQPKRITLAYDELQNLSESALPAVEQLFGEDSQGEPTISLVNSPNAPHQDIILPICYRNTPWALTLAHGLGLGTAREGGLVQSFDDLSLWHDIGYRIVDGEFQKGSTVTLERSPDSHPNYFSALLTPEDAITSKAFADSEDQAQWVAKSIRQNLDEDELEHDDILIVLPNAYTAKSEATTVLMALESLGIQAHLAGVTTSQDEIFQPGSIAIANIYRSKGNESPMVYVLNAHHCVARGRLATVRNILFIAITRSKGWVRLCGWGPRMAELEREIESIRNAHYRLRFRVPTDEQLESMRRIHRDLTASEMDKLRQAEKGLHSFIEALERGEISMDDLPMRLKTSMARHFGGPGSDTG